MHRPPEVLNEPHIRAVFEVYAHHVVASFLVRPRPVSCVVAQAQDGPSKGKGATHDAALAALVGAASRLSRIPHAGQLASGTTLRGVGAVGRATVTPSYAPSLHRPRIRLARFAV